MVLLAELGHDGAICRPRQLAPVGDELLAEGVVNFRSGRLGRALHGRGDGLLYLGLKRLGLLALLRQLALVARALTLEARRDFLGLGLFPAQGVQLHHALVAQFLRGAAHLHELGALPFQLGLGLLNSLGLVVHAGRQVAEETVAAGCLAEVLAGKDVHVPYLGVAVLVGTLDQPFIVVGKCVQAGLHGLDLFLLGGYGCRIFRDLPVALGIFAGCSVKKPDVPVDVPAEQGIDYLVLVNKLNALPDDWEEKLEITKMTNSLGDEVEVESKAYAAYLELKEALASEGVYVDLDNARRSVAEQEDLAKRFTEKYGEAYVAKYVAVPGYSEHHTGLALDLYLNIDGEDVYLNEDMEQYPEIWAKIHAKLADYGFILRYLEGKEHITGYSYEPWHIRYVGSVDIAKEIMSKGITLEGYLGAVNETDVAVDLGKSEIYSEEDLADAVTQIKCKFASFKGCELHVLRYAGDECVTDENLAWVNEKDEAAGYTQVVEFISEFHSPVEDDGQTAWNIDEEYTDWQWWLARTEDGGWDVVDWGY